jgi:hypothetical protein
MSDTPRTDAHNWHDGDYDDPLQAFADFAKQLERELNAANQRIKQLEEAGDALLWYFFPKTTGDISFLQSEAIKQWTKAKEDKL